MNRLVGVVVVAALLALSGRPAEAQSLKPAVKMTRALAELPAAQATAATAGVPLDTTWSRLPVHGSFVTIDAVAVDDPAALAAALAALGAQHIGVAGRLVSARLPIAAISSLNGLAALRFARPAYLVTNAGLATSQGDQAMRANTARAAFGLDGAGVTVGVLSDSFDCLNGATGDVGNGDLPESVTVLQDICTPGSDEGRAMLQIVHDVAPGASLAFATAAFGEANFANNIRALREAGASVIVDDILYLAEPMFQDGVVAQAVDEVAAADVAYFSAAGNFGRSAYAASFVSGTPLADGQFGPEFRGGTPHLFSAGTFKQRVSVQPGGGFFLVLQWDEPFGSLGGDASAANDLDVYLLDSTGTQVISAANTDNIAAGDPVEFLQVFCAAVSTSCVGHLVIVNHAGDAPGRFKYVMLGSPGTTLTPALNAGTIYGHANALGAVAVGAASYLRTPAFGVSPPVKESFSSSGTTPILFDTAGQRLAVPDPRAFKPEIVGPDGANTTFFGFDSDGDSFPNFFGTSAAAPHAAGVAALLRQARPDLTAVQLRDTLATTAINMAASGFDNDTGFGLIQADAALNALHGITITAGPTGAPNPVVGGAAVSVSVIAVDSFGHVLTYAWTATCPGLTSNGVFADATLPVTTWTAPLNATGLSKTCALKVTVRDGHGLTRAGSFTETVAAAPRVTSFSPAAGPVGTLVTITGMSLTGVTEVVFGGNVTSPATPATATAVKALVPSGAITGVLRVTTSTGPGTSAAAFKVTPKIIGFNPFSAVAGSDTVVTVTGTNLRAATGPTVVKVGAVAALVLSNASTLIELRVPLAAVTGKISVTTLDGTGLSAASLLVIQPPKLTSFTPATAPVGSVVTINGTNLLGTALVTFGGNVSTAPTMVTATQVKAIVPDGALTGKLSVTNLAGTGVSAGILKVAPRITGFGPPSAAAGSSTVVTIAGTNLGAASGLTVVRIGALTLAPAFILSSSSTAIEIRVPAAAVTGKISVTTIDGTAVSATPLLVIKPPKPTRIAPPAARVGDVVTISGSGFTGVTDVLFIVGAANVSAPITFASDTTLKVTVPLGARALGQVGVFNAAGAAALPVFFKVLPTITGFSPASGAAGDVVTITGNTLESSPFVGVPPPSPVKVGRFFATVVQSSPTELSFLIPSAASTGRISVDTGGGTAVSATDLVVTTPRRPDLFVFNVELPAVTVRSSSTAVRTISVVTTVGNAGPVPSPPSTVLLGLERVGGAGPVRFLGRVPVPAIAPGGDVRVTAALVVPSDIRVGDYQGRGQVDPDDRVLELVETNNTNIVNITTIVPSIAGSVPFRASLGVFCDEPLLSGAGDLVGTLPLTQNGMSFRGSATLTGTGELAGLSLRTTLTGQLLDDGEVTGLLDFAVTRAGWVVSSGTLSATGTLRDDVLELTVFGFSSNGVFCSIDGTASTSQATAVGLSFVTSAEPGAFGAGATTATLTGPLAPSRWSARLGVRFESTFTNPGEVSFTSPPGGGLSDATATGGVITFHTAEYFSPDVTEPAFPPGGAWNVFYKVPRALNVPMPQAATRLVFPVPAVSVSPDGFLQAVRWTYRNAANASVAPPPFLRQVQVLLEGDGSTVFDSGSQPAAIQALPILAAIPWTCVSRVVIAYVDDLGNRYEVGYPNLGLSCVTGGGAPAFRFLFGFDDGTFNGGTTGVIDLPSPLGFYVARAEYAGATLPDVVIFTGPPASSLDGLPSDTRVLQPGGARYDSLRIGPGTDAFVNGSAHPPGGVYGVRDFSGNTLREFVVPDPHSEARSVLIVPSVTLSDDMLTRIDWTYQDTNGSLVGQGSFMTTVQIVVDGVRNGELLRLYEAEVAPEVRGHVLSSVVDWNEVVTVRLAFVDDLGNVYTSSWNRGSAEPFTVRP